MGIFEKSFFQILNCVGKTTIFGKKVIICNFSRYKGDPSDVETFQNILLCVGDYSI